MTLPVYFEERLVGDVHEDADGPRFVYAASWTEDRQAFPISISMPLTEREVEPARFLTWASNLLPEAEQLVVISRQLGVAQTDILALLDAIGRDTAGALSFGAPGLTSTERWQRIETGDDPREGRGDGLDALSPAELLEQLELELEVASRLLRRVF